MGLLKKKKKIATSAVDHPAGVSIKVNFARVGVVSLDGGA